MEKKEDELDMMTAKLDEKMSKLREACKIAHGAGKVKVVMAAKKRIKKLKKKRRKLLKDRMKAHKSLLMMKGIKPKTESQLSFDLTAEVEEESPIQKGCLNVIAPPAVESRAKDDETSAIP